MSVAHAIPIAKDDRERIDRWIDALWTRRFVADENLGSLKASQLLSMLVELKVSQDVLSLREKGELVSALRERRSSSCVICTDSFKEGDAFRLTECGHGFHDGCLRDWAIKNPQCPVCTTAIRAPRHHPTTRSASSGSLRDQDNMSRAFRSAESIWNEVGSSTGPEPKRSRKESCAQQ